MDYAAPPVIAAVFSLFHLDKRPITRAIPVAATAIAKEIFRPCMYATKMPGTCSGVKTLRSSVAPVAMTVAGSTPGAEKGSVLMRIFTKADCEAETIKAPPTVWKTTYLLVTRSFTANK